MNGKGSARRPQNISQDEYDANYERNFGKHFPLYTALLKSGYFWEKYPQLTGDWLKDFRTFIQLQEES